MPSKWIWPFELQDKLGEGGMGVVYRARYVGNNRIVAVKLLPNDVAANETLVARFERELEILQQLRHPNIVHCFGGVCESKQRFYAMELVEGGTLSELLKRKGRLSWDHVVEYGLQMCAGLQHAHERGVVHRDVKPGNFLLTKSGQLKLSDFGLATMVAASRITTAGKTGGTFLYMAPEQIRGKPGVSNRTDLYALGCVFFELLTGRPPFDGDTPAEVLHKHLKEPPPQVASLMLDCPPGLDQLVSELLRKSPEERPASATEVQLRLEAIVRPSLSAVDPFARTPSAQLPVLSAPASAEDDDEASPRRSRWNGLTTAWCAVAVVCAVLAAWGWSRAREASVQLARIEAAWVALVQHGDPDQRAAALNHLAELGPLSTQTAHVVAEQFRSPEEALRVAALRTLQQQPAAGGGYLAEIQRIQRTDESQYVRQQAELTIAAIRERPGGGGATLKLVLALLGVAAVAAGWWIWSTQRWRRWFR